MNILMQISKTEILKQNYIKWLISKFAGATLSMPSRGSINLFHNNDEKVIMLTEELNKDWDKSMPAFADPRCHVKHTNIQPVDARKKPSTDPKKNAEYEAKLVKRGEEAIHTMIRQQQFGAIYTLWTGSNSYDPLDKWENENEIPKFLVNMELAKEFSIPMETGYPSNQARGWRYLTNKATAGTFPDVTTLQREATRLMKMADDLQRAMDQNNFEPLEAMSGNDLDTMREPIKTPEQGIEQMRAYNFKKKILEGAGKIHKQWLQIEGPKVKALMNSKATGDDAWAEQIMASLPSA